MCLQKQKLGGYVDPFHKQDPSQMKSLISELKSEDLEGETTWLMLELKAKDLGRGRAAACKSHLFPHGFFFWFNLTLFITFILYF